MKIKVGLNKQSVKNAINALKTAKKQLQGEMLNEFYKECYNYFVGQCSVYLNQSTIGESVKAEIDSGWNYERTENGARFVNNAEKAVFVEFGVGSVGQDKPHKNAKNLGNDYKYNIGAYILPDNSWIFSVSDDSHIDIEQDSVLNRTEHTVRTKGSPSIMYAYQALMDLKDRYKRIWKEIKIKYWG